MARIPHALGVAAAVALAVGVLALPASAARPANGDHQVTSAHFVVHYYTDLDPSTGEPSKEYSTQTEASDVASYAERAYALYSSWGYGPPVNDGDGKTDIYIEDLSGPPPVEGFFDPDGSAPYPVSDSGAFEIPTLTQITKIFAPANGDSASEEDQLLVANLVFEMFTFATWTTSDEGDLWLHQGAAQWAAFNVLGYPGGSPLTALGPADIALDCHENLGPGYAMCDPSPYFDEGASRWAFYQQLANKYGMGFMKTVFAKGATGMTAGNALANVLAAKGDSLANEFNDYAQRLMSGNFGVPTLATIRPTPFAGVQVGTTTNAAIPSVQIPASHLMARYVTFQRGDGDGSHACYAASLAITVTMPSGTSSQPYYYWDVAGSSPQPLSVSGDTASITVPWDTCDWGDTRGWVSLPDASTTVNGVSFTVSGKVTVDTTTPATASPAPTQTPIWGTTVPVPSTDVAPTIDVFGPELLKVSATSRVIRLIVNSSSVGSLNASLGSTKLGTSGLRAGNNDIRFTVPASMLTALRKSSSVTNVLTLTPMSSSGATAGQPVTRHVSIAAAPKAKPKHKTPKKPKKHKK